MKKCFAILLIVLTGLLTSLSLTGCHKPSTRQETAENETEWMPDEHLRAAVRNALGLAPDVSLTPSQLEGLTELHATWHPMRREIRSLKGLEYATRLEVLNLYWAPVVDLTPLTGLTRLKKLDLHHNQISDVSALTQLTSLKVLEIQSNPIQDRTPLRTLRKSNPKIKIGEGETINEQIQSNLGETLCH